MLCGGWKWLFAVALALSCSAAAATEADLPTDAGTADHWDGGVETALDAGLSAPPMLPVEESDTRAEESDGGANEAEQVPDAGTPQRARIVSIDTGKVVFEGPLPREDFPLEVSPGEYELQRDGRAAERVSVDRGDDLFIPGTRLRLQGTVLTSSRAYSEDPRVVRTVMAEGMRFVQLEAGVTLDRRAALDWSGGFSLDYGVTDRLQWTVPFPYFTYAAGPLREREWIFEGGINGFSLSNLGLMLPVGARLSHRRFVSDSESLIAGVGTTSQLFVGSLASRFGQLPLWDVFGQVGYTKNYGNWLTLNLGAGVSGLVDASADRFLPPVTGATTYGRAVRISIGSPLNIGTRRFPLLQLHLNERMSADAHLVVTTWYAGERGLGMITEALLGFSAALY